MMRSADDYNAAVIVAHPDDETLWAGGTVLGRTAYHWYVITMCRASDPDRAPKFKQALKRLGAHGAMGDLDDDPEQVPLQNELIEQTILSLLPSRHFDCVLTHSPGGEYTRHRRHEQTARAVLALWTAGTLLADELLMFAYEDGCGTYLPRPVKNASVYTCLDENIWQTKYEIITKTYNFAPMSFEARTTPRAEAFWRLTSSANARVWLTKEAYRHESARTV